MHINEERLNKNGCPMRIVEYIDNRNIVVEFQDKYKARVNTSYGNFKRGIVRNPYYPTVYGAGISGNKYPIIVDGEQSKEYSIWRSIIGRSFYKKAKDKQPTYKEVICCEEWLLFENFYEWLHKQPNFNKWFNGERWAVDKDILNKGNKVYSPENCCLVPQKVNGLFAKSDAARGDYPIGVAKVNSGYMARCKNPFTNVMEYLGVYTTPEKAFLAYKKYKEKAIKQMAQEEYDNDNITKECYEAMMNYKVEITD